jgi:hypothetical protein
VQANVAWAVDAVDLSGRFCHLCDGVQAVAVGLEDEVVVDCQKSPPQVDWRQGGRQVRGDRGFEVAVQVQCLCPLDRSRHLCLQEETCDAPLAVDTAMIGFVLRFRAQRRRHWVDAGQKAHQGDCGRHLILPWHAL